MYFSVTYTGVKVLSRAQISLLLLTKLPLSTIPFCRPRAREKHNRYDKSSPGFPARRQFYWKRKLHLFDLLFFPLVDSLRRGWTRREEEGGGEESERRNFRINCAREETFPVGRLWSHFGLHCLPPGLPSRSFRGGARCREKGGGANQAGLATSRMALRLYQCHSRWVIRALESIVTYVDGRFSGFRQIRLSFYAYLHLLSTY